MNKKIITFRNIRRIIYLGFILYIIGGMLFLVNPLLLGASKKNIDINLSESDLINHVEFLVTLDKQRSYKNIDSLNKVSEYIYNYFKKSGCDDVSYQKYNIKDKEYKNIICLFNGKIEEKIIVGAHYDVYGEENGDYKGADDNASGVAGILELSRLVGENKNKLDNTIEFVAYTLEEPPYFASKEMGSYIHAKSLFDNKEKVKYMIALETIGYFSDEKIQEYPIKVLSRLYPSKGNFIAIVGKMFDFDIKNIKKSMISYSDIDTWSLSSPSFVMGVDFSDHRNYWEFGYKAYMITDTAFFRNKYYHTEEDTIEKLDFGKMKEVVKGVYGILVD